MYITSSEFDKQINNTLRNVSYVKVMFGISNEDIPTLSTIKDNDHIEYSEVDKLDLGVDVFKTYETLEPNRFCLDGKNMLPRKTNIDYQGYCSNTISGTDTATNNYKVTPKITVTFPEPISTRGLTLQFDTTKNDFIKKLRIITYNNNRVVEDMTKISDVSDYPMLIMNRDFKPFDKMVVEIIETFPSYRRARILSMLFGVMRIITDTELVSCNLKSKTELVATSLPTCNFNFTVLDTTNSYDIDNPNNIHNYLESGQPVGFLYGYELSDGRIEWIPMTKTYTTGKVSVNGNKNLSELTFETSSILDKFNVIYDEATYGTKTLYTIAKDIANFVGYPNALDLDDELMNFKTDIPLPKLTARELLQLIANAGMCTMSINRAGQLVIRREELFVNDTNFTLDFNNMLSDPKTNKIPFIRNLISGYNTNLVDSERTELLKTSISSEKERMFVLEYENSINQSYSVSGNLKVIGSPKWYCGAVKLTLIGNGEITVTGNKVTQNNVKFISDYSQEGSDLEVYNPLINNEIWLVEYINYLYRYYSRRVDYTVDNRGYANIDVGDKIDIENNYSDMVSVTVLEQNLDYNGSLKGQNKFLSNKRSVLNERDK